MGFHANELLKRNIDTLLRARGQQRKDLAQWCRRSDAWLVQILNKPNRGMPLRYLDRIADFFGIATYQLLQPGISPLTERRRGLERRGARDRRVGRGGLTKPTQVAASAALIELISYLTSDEQADFVRTVGDQLRGRLPRHDQDTAAVAPESGAKRQQSIAGAARGKMARRGEQAPNAEPQGTSRGKDHGR